VLEVLRAYEVCFIRMGQPSDPGARPAVASRLDALFPNDNDDVNHELMQLLVYLESPKVIEKSLALLEKAKTQEEQLFYVFNLRNVSDGWTLPQRQAYFKWLNTRRADTPAARATSCSSRTSRKSDSTLGDEERIALAPLLKPPMELAATPTASQPPRSVVKNWQMADLVPRLDKLKSGRSFENGKAAYATVSCAKCHRFNGDGGGSGPDISGVGKPLPTGRSARSDRPAVEGDLGSVPGDGDHHEEEGRARRHDPGGERSAGRRATQPAVDLHRDREKGPDQHPSAVKGVDHAERVDRRAEGRRSARSAGVPAISRGPERSRVPQGGHGIGPNDCGISEVIQMWHGAAHAARRAAAE
jgi:mono/diheme cytochrome c family protein